MSVVSIPGRQKSWQIADEIGSLLDELKTDGNALGERLRRLARARGLASDEDAARHVGVSYRQYQRWLSGESEPRAGSLKLIAEAFGVPLTELLGEPDQSQLDRIEDMLERLVARAEGETVTPAEGEDQAPAVVADASARLVEAAGSRQRKAPARPKSEPAAKPRKRA